MTKLTRALVAIIIAALIALGFVAGYLIGNSASATTTISADAPERRTALFMGTTDFRFTPDQPSTYGPTTA